MSLCVCVKYQASSSVPDFLIVQPKGSCCVTHAVNTECKMLYLLIVYSVISMGLARYEKCFVWCFVVGPIVFCWNWKLMMPCLRLSSVIHTDVLDHLARTHFVTRVLSHLTYTVYIFFFSLSQTQNIVHTFVNDNSLALGRVFSGYRIYSYK